jgi:hypothetical protein
MSQSRRERRRLQREIKKLDPTGNVLSNIITPETGAEIRRKYLQKIKNEEISKMENPEIQNENLDFIEKTEDVSYSSFRGLLAKKNWGSED